MHHQQECGEMRREYGKTSNGCGEIHMENYLKEALAQKEQALVMYVKFMREAQDKGNQEYAALFADLAKAEEKHIAAIRDQVFQETGSADLNDYQLQNNDVSQYKS